MTKKEKLAKLITVLEVNHNSLIEVLTKKDFNHSIEVVLSLIPAICSAYLKVDGNKDWAKFGSSDLANAILSDDFITGAKQKQKQKEINSMRKKINLKS